MVAGFFLLIAREPEKSREPENEYPKIPESTRDLRGRTKSHVEFPIKNSWVPPPKSAPVSHQSLEMTWREAKTNVGHMLTENENPIKTQEHPRISKNIR
jgi:hypothetical protein